jgi:carboxyl-terminal processing protease
MRLPRSRFEFRSGSRIWALAPTLGLLVISAVVDVTRASEPAEVDRAIFSEVWTLVRDQFYDPELRGVDWDAVRKRYGVKAANALSVEELSRVLNEMLGELDTSHTRHFTPLEPEYYQLLAIFSDSPLAEQIAESFPDGVSYTSAGLLTETIDGEIYVRGVLDGSPASAAGVLVGDRILAADGRPFHAVRSFEDKDDVRVELRLQRTADPESVVEIGVTPRRIEPRDEFREALSSSAETFRRGRHKIGYAHVWSYAGRQYHEELQGILGSPEFDDVDGLVLDLRDGWGGANPDYLNLFTCSLPVMTFVPRDGDRGTFDPCWKKPVVLLVDDRTRSGKEILAFGFRRYGIGTVVGARTAGAVVAGRAFVLGDGSLLYLATADVLIDGERLEGGGVEPDVEVPFELPYAQGKDPRLERAIEVVVEQLEAGS